MGIYIYIAPIMNTPSVKHSNVPHWLPLGFFTNYHVLNLSGIVNTYKNELYF